MAKIYDSIVICANCLAKMPEGDALYDEREEHYLCSRNCFDEWVDSHFEEISEYYFERNIGY